MGRIDRITVYSLRLTVLFCWFFSIMVGLTALQSHNTVEIVLKGAVVGVGAWCGWGILNRRSQVILYTVGLCFYALFGSLVWLYHSTFLPIFYGQVLEFGLYDYLAFIYIICASLVIKFLLSKKAKRYLIK